MNKKLSTILFVLAGTVLNILLMIIFIMGLLAGVSFTLKALGYEPGHTIYIPFLIAAILGGMVLAFVVYSKITKFVIAKYDLEKYLEPLIKPRRR
ncbi:MAG: hypothetical protein OCD02_15840 [Spirochaetaceae bacterium]